MDKAHLNTNPYWNKYPVKYDIGKTYLNTKPYWNKYPVKYNISKVKWMGF